MADNEGVTKAIASLFRDDSDIVFLSIYVQIIYSGIMVGNVGLWASKNVGVEGSNIRLEKWRAT